MSMWSSLLCVLCLRPASGKVFFKETFDELWETRWVKSQKHVHENAQGDFKLATGKWYADPVEDLGLETSKDEDHRYFQISAAFPSFSNRDMDLYLQFQTKWEQNVECGGSYIKIGPTMPDQTQFGGDTPWHIMFGPEKCGNLNVKTHLRIFAEGKENEKKDKLPYVQSHSPANHEKFGLSHLYRCVITHDNVIRVEIDGKKVYQGNIREGWDILAPEWIPDETMSRPDEWDERETLDDPEDKKPEDWVDEARLPDPRAEQPDDWDESEDGEWEPSTLPNPEFKGNWRAKQMRNTKYMGKWRPHYKKNPDYNNNKLLYLFRDIGYIGIDNWQVKAGTIFDNIILTDNKATADKFMEKWRKVSEAEMLEYDELTHDRKDKEWFDKFNRQDYEYDDYLDAFDNKKQDDL